MPTDCLWLQVQLGLLDDRRVEQRRFVQRSDVELNGAELRRRLREECALADPVPAGVLDGPALRPAGVGPAVISSCLQLSCYAMVKMFTFRRRAELCLPVNKLNEVACCWTN